MDPFLFPYHIVPQRLTFADLLNCVTQLPYDDEKCVRLLHALRECVVNKVYMHSYLRVLVYLDEPQIQHLLQSAEAIRKDYPKEDWLHLTALIHDLGKVLTLPQFGKLPQWAVVDLSAQDKTMTKTIHYRAPLLLVLFLIHSSKLSARIMVTKQGEEGVTNLKDNTDGDDLVHMEGTESMNELMGLEACNSEDEECFQRRMMAEAHLDYIYTQHHKS